MANLISPTTLVTMTLLNPSPTFSSSTSDSLSLPLSTQSASLPSQTVSSSISSTSSRSSSPSTSASSSSTSASLSSQVPPTTTTLTPRLAIQMTRSSFTPMLSSSNSALPKRSITIPIPLPWIIVIIIFCIVLIVIAFAIYKSRRWSKIEEEELAVASHNNPRPWSTMEVRPGLIRRTTTSRLREDWQQWIAKPPPLRGGLRRRDSAVLFGPGSGSRLSTEPLLTAHEVEVSGVLESDISDPPPAYTPRRL